MRDKHILSTFVVVVVVAITLLHLMEMKQHVCGGGHSVLEACVVSGCEE